MTPRSRRGLLYVVAITALAYLAYATFFHTVQRQRMFPLADGTRYAFRTPLVALARLIEPAVSFGRAHAVFLPGPAP